VPGSPRSEDARVIAASHDDPERFAEIFDRYYPEIRGYVDRRLGASAADDIAAETFLTAFRKRDRFDPAAGSARPWLYGIATRLVSRHRRDETRRLRALARASARPEPGADEDRATERVLAAQAAPDVARALAALNPGQRDALLLVALGGLSYEDVTRALGVPYGTVCSRVNRARAKLRAALAHLETEVADHG
jgi:RNA polymerase sigma-70 factor (ECF subfamily)